MGSDLEEKGGSVLTGRIFSKIKNIFKIFIP
jgi:hypothetical protein